MPQEEEPWEILSNFAYAVCPACDTDNERDAGVCVKCGQILEREQDDAPVSVLSLDGGRNIVRHVYVAFEDRGNVKKLILAVEGVRAGTLSHSEYKKLVSEVHHVAKIGVALAAAPVVKKRLAEQRDDVQDVGIRIGEQFAGMLRGTTRMLEYLDTLEVQDAEEGWAIAQKAMRELEDLQNEAYSLPPDLNEP